MSLANFIISAASLMLLLGYGGAAAWMSRRTTVNVLPQLPDWPDNEPDEAAELIAAWRDNIEKGRQP